MNDEWVMQKVTCSHCGMSYPVITNYAEWILCSGCNNYHQVQAPEKDDFRMNIQDGGEVEL